MSAAVGAAKLQLPALGALPTAAWWRAREKRVSVGTWGVGSNATAKPNR
jgi:hypothetical protein